MNNRTRDVVCTARADSAVSYLLWSGLVWNLPVENVVLTMKGLQERNTKLLDGTTVEK